MSLYATEDDGRAAERSKGKELKHSTYEFKDLHAFGVTCDIQLTVKEEQKCPRPAPAPKFNLHDKVIVNYQDGSKRNGMIATPAGALTENGYLYKVEMDDPRYDYAYYEYVLTLRIEQPPAPKFHMGQFVYRKHSKARGLVCRLVSSVNQKHLYEVKFEDCSGSLYYFENHLELAPELPKQKFQMGDYVRYADGRYGTVYVSRLSGYSKKFVYYISGSLLPVDEADLELVPPQR